MKITDLSEEGKTGTAVKVNAACCLFGITCLGRKESQTNGSLFEKQKIS